MPLTKWEDITHILNGWFCTILFDGPTPTGHVKRYDGMIDYPNKLVVPTFRNPKNGSSFVPPLYAIVILHTPTNKYDNWTS